MILVDKHTGRQADILLLFYKKRLYYFFSLCCQLDDVLFQDLGNNLLSYSYIYSYLHQINSDCYCHTIHYTQYLSNFHNNQKEKKSRQSEMVCFDGNTSNHRYVKQQMRQMLERRSGTKYLKNQPCDVIKMWDYPSLFQGFSFPLLSSTSFYDVTWLIFQTLCY